MRIFLALASCSLIVVISSSNGYPDPQSKAENKPATQDKRGTQESPLVIQGDITTKTAEKSESDRKQEEEKIEIERSLAKYSGWTAGITFVLVLVTGVLAFVTYKLWESTNTMAKDAKRTADRQAGEMQETLRLAKESSKASRDAADIAHDAMIAGERAFVFPGKFQFWYRPIANGEKRYYFQLFWDNCGDTPTKQLTSHVRFSLRDTQLPEDFDFRYETTEFGRAVIAPKSSVLGPVFPSDGIKPEDLQAVHTSTKFAYVWGWLKYHDVFENTPLHITRYCFQIIVNGNPIDPGPELKGVDFMYPIHPQNNCADEECDQ